MADAPLHVAVGRCYDRVAALAATDHPWPQVRLSVLDSIHAAFRALARRPDVDAAEMSASFHLTLDSAGLTESVALPVFTSRAFRFGNIHVRHDSTLDSVPGLRGRTVGLPEYGMTMAVWIRGMFADQFGVHPQEIRWCTARDPVVTPIPRRVRELGVDVVHSEGGDLWAQLATGDLDAVIGQPPPAHAGRVRRLLADFAAEDTRYCRDSGAFPIMHTIVVRRSVCESRPDDVVALFDAMCWAKRQAVDELRDTIANSVTLPFQQSAVAHASELLGANWWPYGIEANRRTLELLARYSFDQGLSTRLVPVEEMFWAGSHRLVDPG
jgi:4,5-dihydroxyphthalate decarboxylase